MKTLIALLFTASFVAAQTVSPAARDGSNITAARTTWSDAILPSQATHGGKYLKTDGTDVTWETAAGGGDLTSGPVTSSAGVSAIASNALSIAKTSGLQTALDEKARVKDLNNARMQIPWTTKHLTALRQGSYAPVVRALTLGDSWFLPGAVDPLNKLKSRIGEAGGIVTRDVGGTFTLVGGATQTAGKSSYNLSPFGSHFEMSGSGQGIYSTNVLPAARYFTVFYEGLAGGSFQVQYEAPFTGTWTTVATVATDSVATSGFQVWESTAQTPVSARLRVNWVAGNLKIYSVGWTQLSGNVATISNRQGVVDFPTAFGGSAVSEWNLAPQQVWTSLLAWLKPDIIFIREKPDDATADWITNFNQIIGKIRTAWPECDVVWVGRHITGDGDTKPAEVDAYMKQWCDDNNATFVDVMSHMPATLAEARSLGINRDPDNVHLTSQGDVFVGHIVQQHLKQLDSFFADHTPTFSSQWGARLIGSGVKDLWEVSFDGSRGGQGVMRFMDVATGSGNRDAGWSLANYGRQTAANYRMDGGLGIGCKSVSYVQVDQWARWGFGGPAADRSARDIAARVEVNSGTINGHATIPAIAAIGVPSQRVPILKVMRDGATNGSAAGTDTWGWTYDSSVVFEGHTGSGATATATVSGGVITGYTITNGGTGYTSVPTVTLQNVSGGSAGVGTAVLTGGVLTSITVTNGGSGYSLAPLVFIVPVAAVDNDFETIFSYENPAADTYIHTPINTVEGTGAHKRVIGVIPSYVNQTAGEAAVSQWEVYYDEATKKVKVDPNP